MTLSSKHRPSRRTAMLSLAGAALALPARAKVGFVETGVVGSLEEFDKAVAFGFDYFEPSATVVAGLSDSAFNSFRDKVLASRIRCKALNRLMAGPDLIVVGPTVNHTAITNYLSSTMDRSKQLGAELMVWGSPGTRKVPVGFSKDEAWRQIRFFLQRAGDIARSKNLMFVIEPCHQGETNSLNTATETLRMLQEANHPNVQLMIDVRHLRTEKEDPEVIRTAGDRLKHWHFSSPTGGWPKSTEDDPDYGRLFKFLKQIYFHGSMSIEARGVYETDAAPALAFFQKMLA